MIIVPKRDIRSFLLGRAAAHDGIERLVNSILKQCVEKKSDVPASTELLLQICHSSLSKKYESEEPKDHCLGPVAVAAVFMRDASIFAKVVEQTALGFHKNSYSKLGELICLQDLFVSEDELVCTALFPSFY